VLSPCCLPLPPTYLLLTVNEARSYFVSTIRGYETSPRAF
jgi:cytochrome c biogenesis protein CcdA